MSGVTRRGMVKAVAVAGGVALAGGGATLVTAQEGQEAPTATTDAKVRLRAATKIWRLVNFPSAAALVSWLNLPPAQGAGEVVIVSVAPNGAVTAMVFL